MRLTALLLALTATAFPQSFPLTSTDGLKMHHLAGEPASYNGKNGLKVTEAGGTRATEDRLVILTKTDFQDGVIEAEIAGRPGAGAAAAARGFVGIAFRVNPDASKFEAFYLRPTNGRAEDQERRNHSAQYISFPDFPWQRLRKEFPEKYESYVDLVSGEWTKVKIEVQGAKAKLYVHGNAQPTLVVNDLKHGTSKGNVALWIGPGTEAYFTNLKVTR